MTVSEQIIQLKNDFDAVYEAGIAAASCNVDHEALRKEGFDEGHETGYLAGETVGYNSGYSEGEISGYTNGYIEGKNSVPNVVEYAPSLYYVFNKAIFPDNYELTINCPNATDMRFFIAGSTGLVKLVIKHGSPDLLVNGQNAFQCKTLEVLDLSEFKAKFNNISGMFNGNIKLTEIKGVLDLSEATSTNNLIFNSCYVLEEVRFKANSIKITISFASSSQLSVVSIQSIIDGLATITEAQTITFNSAAVLTDAQKATISSKGWTLVQ